jgi:hypothetical protein
LSNSKGTKPPSRLLIGQNIRVEKKSLQDISDKQYQSEKEIFLYYRLQRGISNLKWEQILGNL